MRMFGIDYSSKKTVTCVCVCVWHVWSNSLYTFSGPHFLVHSQPPHIYHPVVVFFFGGWINGDFYQIETPCHFLKPLSHPSRFLEDLRPSKELHPPRDLIFRREGTVTDQWPSILVARKLREWTGTFGVWKYRKLKHRKCLDTISRSEKNI